MKHSGTFKIGNNGHPPEQSVEAFSSHGGEGLVKAIRNVKAEVSELIFQMDLATRLNVDEGPFRTNKSREKNNIAGPALIAALDGESEDAKKEILQKFAEFLREKMGYYGVDRTDDTLQVFLRGLSEEQINKYVSIKDEPMRADFLMLEAMLQEDSKGRNGFDLMGVELAGTKGDNTYRQAAGLYLKQNDIIEDIPETPPTIAPGVENRQLMDNARLREKS